MKYMSCLQVAIGWGRLNENVAGPVSRVLLQVDLPVQSSHMKSSDCANQIYDPEKQFCAGVSTGGKDTCQGDRSASMHVRCRESAYLVVDHCCSITIKLGKSLA
jgi:hypothetical protein